MSFYGYDPIAWNAQKMAAMKSGAQGVNQAIQGVAQIAGGVVEGVQQNKKAEQEATYSRNVMANLMREAAKISPDIAQQFADAGYTDPVEMLPTAREIRQNPELYSKQFAEQGLTLAVAIADSGADPATIDSILGLPGWSEKAMALLDKAGLGKEVDRVSQGQGATNTVQVPGVAGQGGGAFTETELIGKPATQEEALSRIDPRYAGRGDEIMQHTQMQALPSRRDVAEEERAGRTLDMREQEAQQRTRDYQSDKWYQHMLAKDKAIAAAYDDIEDNLRQQADDTRQARADYVTAEDKAQRAAELQKQISSGKDETGSVKRELAKMGDLVTLKTAAEEAKAAYERAKRRELQLEKAKERYRNNAESDLIDAYKRGATEVETQQDIALTRRAEELLRQPSGLGVGTLASQYAGGGSIRGYPLLEKVAKASGYTAEEVQRAIELLEKRQGGTAPISGGTRKPSRQPLGEILGDM